MANKWLEVSSNDVIDLINNKQPEWFNKKEKIAISQMMKDLSKDDLGKVRTYIQDEVNKWSKADLLSLTEKVESLNNLPYGFEWIIEWSESEFFTEMFDSEPRKKAITLWLNNLIIKNIPSEILSWLWKSQSETIQLLIWNKVVSKIWFMSGSSYMMKKGLEKMTGFVDSSVSVAKKWSEMAKSEDFDITKLWETFDKIQAIFESDDKDKEKKWNKLLWEVTKYFTHLTKDYFSNLNQVFSIAKENNIDQNPDYLQLLDNPMIMNEVLEKWEYKNNGIEINLDKKIISGLEKNTTSETDKKTFMKEVVQNTNDTWLRIDSLKDKVDKVAGLFVKFWFDSSELKKFQNDLKEIPLVWELLSFILWFFLWDKIFNAIDKIHDSQKYKAVVEKAQVYFSNDKVELPFEKTEKLEKKDGSNVEKFLKSVEAFELEQAWDTKIEKSVIFADNFWEIVFSKERSIDPIYKEIQDKINVISQNDDTISQEDYFVALSKLKFIIPISVATASVNVNNWSNKPTDVQTADLLTDKQTWITKSNLESTSNKTPTEIEIVKPSQIDDNIEVAVVNTNAWGNNDKISVESSTKKIPQEKQKIEIVPEVKNNKPLAEQLANITSLPMDIYIDWKKTPIDIGSDKKSLLLWWKKYNVLINVGIWNFSEDVLDSVVNIDWWIKLTANWKSNTFKWKELADVLDELIKNNSYKKEINKITNLIIS